MGAVPALSEIPDLRSEIDRKAFEQLERLAGQLESGKINQAMFNTGVQTVWQCVSGLASEWVIDTITEVKDMWIENELLDLRLFYCPAEGAIMLIRKLGEGSLALRSLPTGRKMDWDFEKTTNPSREALLKQNQVEQMLVGKGFNRITKESV